MGYPFSTILVVLLGGTLLGCGDTPAFTRPRLSEDWFRAEYEITTPVGQPVAIDWSPGSQAVFQVYSKGEVVFSVTGEPPVTYVCGEHGAVEFKLWVGNEVPADSGWYFCGTRPVQELPADHPERMFRGYPSIY